MSDRNRDELERLRARLKPVENRKRVLDKLIKIEGNPEARGKHWGGYRSPIESYTSTFWYLLDKQHIPDIVFAKKNTEGEPKQVFGLDLMSDTTALRGLPLDAGIALGLVETREAEAIDKDRLRRIEYVTGDIIDESSWEKIDAASRRLGINRFDIILCRPIAGTSTIPGDFHTLNYLLSNMWKRLSERQGLVLTEVHPLLALDLYDWVLRFRNTTGIDIQSAVFHIDSVNPVNPQLRIIKNQNDPTSLPEIS